MASARSTGLSQRPTLRHSRLMVTMASVGVFALGSAVLGPAAAGAATSVGGAPKASQSSSRVAPDPGRSAYSWGNNSPYGSLGDGTTTSRGVPGAVLDGANSSGTWLTVSGGAWNGCAIGRDDSSYCWGDNSAGQLGTGSAGGSSGLPVRVTGGPVAWEFVTPGRSHACGIGDDSDVYCWGGNFRGQLGNGTTVDSSVPARVTGGPADWNSVSAGNRHTCAVGSDASAYCWGEGGYGQLGTGATTDDSVPVQVGSGFAGPAGWKAVSAGYSHTCGVSTDDSAYCWGNNASGQLGNGTTVDDSLPVRVTGGPSSWLTVLAGSSFSCGLGIDLRAYCWGNNQFGQIGNGANSNVSTPVQVTAPLNQAVRTLSTVGNAVHACATTDDSVYCWGDNRYGQLGNGSSDDSSSVPVSVAFPGGPSDGRVPILAVGGSFTFLVGAYGSAPSAPVFTSASPPSTGTVGTAYSGYTFAASGATPITFTVANGTPPPGITLASNGVLSGVPTTVGTFSFAVEASNGINPDAVTSSITITVSAPPMPAPAYPPSAPRSIAAIAGDTQAEVSWAAPADAGSFPVSDYQVQAVPGGATCMAKAPTQSCIVTGLTNGTAYTFTVRALNGAGWGPVSEPSDPVTPRAPVTISIQILGSRDADDPRLARVTGITTGLVGEKVTPWMRFPGQRAYTAGLRSPIVGSDGTFDWSRRAGKTLTVYFAHADVKSNDVVISRR